MTVLIEKHNQGNYQLSTSDEISRYALEVLAIAKKADAASARTVDPNRSADLFLEDQAEEFELRNLWDRYGMGIIGITMPYSNVVDSFVGAATEVFSEYL